MATGKHLKIYIGDLELKNVSIDGSQIEKWTYKERLVIYGGKALHELLEKMIEDEEYEKAAIIRDEISEREERDVALNLLNGKDKRET